jgi:hypothetical protein
MELWLLLAYPLGSFTKPLGKETSHFLLGGFAISG